MATYNLAASDLITLLNSTVTNPTGRAILESIESAFNSAFPFGNTKVQTTNGPADTVPPGYTIENSPTVPDPTSTIPGPYQLELITLPTSTVSGSNFIPGAFGTETVKTGFTITTSGGVVIGAGDQFVGVTDVNTGTTADTLIGGVGLERLVSGQGSNILVSGNLALADGGSGLGADSLVGGSGADTLIGGFNSRLQAGTGNNTLKSSTITTGHDSLIGGTGNDLLVAQAGNNRLVAGTGSNTLQGGSGHDTLVAGGLHTTFQVGAGATRIVDAIANSRDTIFAGSGNDTVLLAYNTQNLGASIVGSSGGLRIADLAGSNTIVGGQGADTVVLSSVVSGVTQTNTSNQTITAGPGGVRVVTNEAFSSYSNQTSAGGVNTVTFSDTHQTLTINDTTGTSVTIVFGDGHAAVKV